MKCNYLQFLNKNRLGIPALGVDEKYLLILQNFGHDIEMISSTFERQKQDPPLGRDMPPVAGRIMWVRHLFGRIQGPMDIFLQVILNFCHFTTRFGRAIVLLLFIYSVPMSACFF